MARPVGIRVSDDFAAAHPEADPTCTEAVVNLLVAAGLVLDRMDGLLRPLGLSTSTFNVLQILDGDPDPLSPSQVTERYPMPITTATMTGLVDTLERRGWTERRPHPSDRRRVLIHVTPEGRAVRARAESLVLQAEKEWLAATGQAERRRLTDGLARVVDHLRSEGRPDT